jgi:peptidoglycan/xylan/chitin deacetylase (PgdA/CDA1 family)
MFKSTIKKLVFALIAIMGRQNWRCRNNKLLVVTYHRVLPRNHPDLTTIQPGMYVFEDTFESHIKYLNENYNIVNLEDWVSKYKNGQDLPINSCAITFDDGWRDNYEYAYPIFKKYNLPVSIYIVASKVGSRNGFWPEMLTNLLWQAGNGIADELLWNSQLMDWIRAASDEIYNPEEPSQEHLNIIVENVKKKYTDEVIIGMLKSIEESFPKLNTSTERDILNWDEINEMVNSGLVNIGSHTLDHIRLTENVNNNDILSQVVESKHLIEKNMLSSVSIFCYPNGDITDYAEKLVKQHYDAALTTINGWNSTNIDLYRIKRIHIHEDGAKTNNQFRAKLSGWI